MVLLTMNSPLLIKKHSGLSSTHIPNLTKCCRSRKTYLRTPPTRNTGVERE